MCEKQNFTVGPCGVCEIEDFIGTDSSLCDVHYSAPNVEYNYGYDYQVARLDGYSYGYYIGIDRFCSVDGEWAKEYMLYEYAVFDEMERDEANEALYKHLLECAIAQGCCRILCEKKGGNDEFYSYLAEKGFLDGEEYLTLPLPDAKLPIRDEVLLPTKGDTVSFEQAYFLREQNFYVDKKELRLDWQGEKICISRKTGVCKFSNAFEVVGGKDFVLDSQRALCQIDICIQLLEMGVKENINLYLPEEKVNALTPDVLVGKWAIFISEEPMSLIERRYFLTDLKKTGLYDRVSFYEFQFDFEVGGRKLTLYYTDLDKA